LAFAVSIEERADWASPVVGSGEERRDVLAFVVVVGSLGTSGSCFVAAARETAERPPITRDRDRSFFVGGIEG
jgi:hypothetical protein